MEMGVGQNILCKLFYISKEMRIEPYANIYAKQIEKGICLGFNSFLKKTDKY